MGTYRVYLRGGDLCVNALNRFYPGRGRVNQYIVFAGTPVLESFVVDVDASDEDEALQLAGAELEFARLNYTFS